MGWQRYICLIWLVFVFSFCWLPVDSWSDCSSTPSGMVSWWKAEGNAQDTWDGNHGSLQNGTAYDTGKVGQAFSFDGNNDYVFFSNTLNIDGGAEATYMAWVYPKATPAVGAYFGLLGAGDSTSPVWTTQQCRLLYWKTADSPSGMAKFYIDCGTNDTEPSYKGRLSANDYPINQWYSVAGVFNNGALDIYVNGLLDNGTETGIDPGTVINTNANNYVWLGAMVQSDQTAFFVPFNGLIDEASIYNRALTANEITAMYNAGSAGLCIPEYSLTITKIGNGTGTITSVPTGIDCGMACSSYYGHGTQVELTASMSPGSTFTGWSGAGCSGTGTCLVTMDQVKSVTGTFALNTYTLSVTPSGTGSGGVTGNGLDCAWNGSGSSGTCSVNLDYNTAVSLTATPNVGSAFSGWSGGSGSAAGCSGTGVCVFNLTEASGIGSIFTRKSLIYLPLILRP